MKLIENYIPLSFANKIRRALNSYQSIILG